MNSELQLQIEAKTKPFRKQGEKLQSWIARLGIGVQQIRDLSDQELKNLVSVAEQSSVGRATMTWRELQRQIDDPRPTPVLAGIAQRIREGVPVTVIGEDKALLAKTKPFRHKNEKLLSWISRTGVSVQQIRDLSDRELKNLVAVAEKTAADAMGERWAPVEPKPRPLRSSSGGEMHATFAAGPEFEPKDVQILTPNAALVG